VRQAITVALDDRDRVSTAQRGVADIEAQPDTGRRRRLHEPIELRGRLDIGRRVIVEGQRAPELRGLGAKPIQECAKPTPAVIGQGRRIVRASDALVAIRRLLQGDDQDFATGGVEVPQGGASEFSRGRTRPRAITGEGHVQLGESQAAGCE